MEYFLEQCLNSVFKAGRNCNIEVFVVDNNSTDGSIAMLEEKFPDVDSYDINITGLSGGEKMRLSLVFTLLETIKKKKQILILDEPEQGLDEATRRQVITNILNYLDIQSNFSIFFK